MIEPGRTWVSRITADLPPRWQQQLIGRWDWKRQQIEEPDFFGVGPVAAEARANFQIRATVDSLGNVRLPLDAKDSEICQEADKIAARAQELAFCGAIDADMQQEPRFGFVGPSTGKTIKARSTIFKTAEQLRASMAKIAQGYAIKPPLNDPDKTAHVEDGPAIARMSDPQWWRRQLRRVHAKYVEGAAIDLGYVNRARDCYVSNESVLRRAEQNDRNAAALENTVMENEDGDEYTLAELAAKGPANKAIRRAELMTRIAGFERIAVDMGHVGLFMTITAPSRMHKWSTTGKNQVFENAKYDGTLPNEAQAHLSLMYGRIRAELARRKIGIYGFRIAEANHDGTPHWHLLIFLDPEYQRHAADFVGPVGPRSAIGRFCAIVRRYALGKGDRAAPARDKSQQCLFASKKKAIAEHKAMLHAWNVAERARQNSDTARKEIGVDFRPIDKTKGCAAGYIAKYVAKNIDGYKLNKDLFDNDAIESSHRIEAWASTWNIRQFQQVGGPPVGPWRELRRVESVPGNAPQCLIDAHRAVNKTRGLDLEKLAANHTLEEVAALAQKAQWDKYVNAQGGVFCGRKYLIRINTMAVEGLGKYGEPLADRPVGVKVLELFTPQWWATGCTAKIPRWLEVDSKRHTWTKKATPVTEAARPGGMSVTGVLSLTPAPSAPWTRVNNCTGVEVQKTVNRAADQETNCAEVEKAGYQAAQIDQEFVLWQSQGAKPNWGGPPV